MHGTHHAQRLLYCIDTLDEQTALARELAESAFVGRHGRIVHHAAKGSTVIVGALEVAHEVERHLSALEQYLLYAELLTQAAQGYHTQQFLARRRDGTEAVGKPGAKLAEFLVLLQAVELAVYEHTLAAGGDIFVGEEQFEVALYLTFAHKILTTDFFFAGSLQLFLVDFAKLVFLQFFHSLS